MDNFMTLRQLAIIGYDDQDEEDGPSLEATFWASTGRGMVKAVIPLDGKLLELFNDIEHAVRERIVDEVMP